jgi:hypothetical protein
MRDLFKDLPPDGPDPSWTDATRRRLLEHVSAKRRKRRRTTAGWVAALAMSAAVLLMLMLLPSSGVSFAGVQRSIERAQTIQCYSTLILVQDKVETSLSTAHSWADRDLGVRLDIQALGMPLAQFWLPRQGQPILVDHTHRAVVPIHLPDELDAQALLRFDPTTLVRRLGRVSSDIMPIPSDESSAQPNEIGFRVPAKAVGLSDESTLDIWVDTNTQLPQRITIHVPLNDRDALIWKLDRFTWYEPIQAGVLLVDLPTDYERIDPLVVPTPGEEPLVRTLGRYASLKQGRFPVTEMVAWESLAKMVLVALKPASAWRDLPEPMNNELGQREAIGDAIAGGLFCFQLQENGAEPEYFGARVRLGDEQTLMRWRQPDGSTRLINGQLKSETMP